MLASEIIHKERCIFGGVRNYRNVIRHWKAWMLLAKLCFHWEKVVLNL